jgi:branched-subunit amino acid ABC-type transport system permease component
MIFDDRGLPWTIRLSLGWTIFLALCCAGTLFIPLGLYLAYWVRTRQGRSAAFWCYLIFTAIVILALLVPDELSRHLSPVTTVVLVVVLAVLLVLFVAAPLVLRTEIRSIYRRSWGMDLPINPLLTVLFSSVYLNYSVPDLPVPPAATTASQESNPASTVP